MVTQSFATSADRSVAPRLPVGEGRLIAFRLAAHGPSSMARLGRLLLRPQLLHLVATPTKKERHQVVLEMISRIGSASIFTSARSNRRWGYRVNVPNPPCGQLMQQRATRPLVGIGWRPVSGRKAEA